MYSKFAHRFIQLPAIFIPIYLIEYEKFVSPTDNKIRRTLKPPPKIFAAVQWPQTKISESVNKFHSQCFTVRYCVFVNKQFARKNIIYFVNTFLNQFIYLCSAHKQTRTQYWTRNRTHSFSMQLNCVYSVHSHTHHTQSLMLLYRAIQ